MADSSPKQKAALWVAAVFVLGTALGGVLGYSFARHTVSAAAPAPTQQLTVAQKVERLTRELSLTDTQKQQLDVILTEVHAEYATIHKQSDPLIEDARQRGRNRIRAILTDEQKPKFEEFLRKLDEERKRAAQQQ
jgi:Spy/CpxP family protein refolding chaperone